MAHFCFINIWPIFVLLTYGPVFFGFSSVWPIFCFINIWPSFVLLIYGPICVVLIYGPFFALLIYGPFFLLLMYGPVSLMGERRGVYRVLVGKLEGKRPLGRPRRRWEDNIKMDLQEVGCGSMDWIDLAQDRDRWRALLMR